MATKRIRLEGLGRDIELASCRVNEYPTVRRLAIQLLDVGEESVLQGTAEEIVSTFAPGLPVDELTVNDLWEILMAKAGTAQSELLRRMPEVAGQKMVDFLSTPEQTERLFRAVREELSETMETGEST